MLCGSTCPADCRLTNIFRLVNLLIWLGDCLLLLLSFFPILFNWFCVDTLFRFLLGLISFWLGIFSCNSTCAFSLWLDRCAWLPNFLLLHLILIWLFSHIRLFVLQVLLAFDLLLSLFRTFSLFILFCLALHFLFGWGLGARSALLLFSIFSILSFLSFTVFLDLLDFLFRLFLGLSLCDLFLGCFRFHHCDWSDRGLDSFTFLFSI